MGIDDGPFRRGLDEETCLTGVLMRLDGTVEAISIESLKIDSSDVLESMINLIPERSRKIIGAVISEGITFGGFGLIDPETFFERTNIPFISITRGKADVDAMKRALNAHHALDSSLINLLDRLQPLQIEIKGRHFIINFHGITESEAVLMLERLMKTGNVPEPVRLAHLISRAAYRYRKNDMKKI